MKRSTQVILLFGCLATLAMAEPVSTTPVAPLPRDIGALLEPILEKHKIPGMAAVALQGDRIVAQGVAGVRKAGNPERITLADKFHLGSDTKAMTATLAAMLVEEGKLKWTATLGELFGDTVKHMRPEWKDVTLQQVLAHRAGLRVRGFGSWLRDRLRISRKPLPTQRRKVVAKALSHSPKFVPGTMYLYANTGYILVGAVIEKITGQAWEEVMRERLFQPLAITTGGFGAPSASGTLDQPWGHHSNGKSVGADADNPAYYGPAGTAHMAIGDWAKFVALHLRGDPANPNSHAALLKPESFAHLHTAAAGEDYTSGWMTGTDPGVNGRRPGDTGRTLWHNGTNMRWYSETWLAPEIDFAVLITSNEGGFGEAAKACDEAADALIDEFAPRPGPAKP